jgi:uncharacterized protein YbjT (DUF2867 family)
VDVLVVGGTGNVGRPLVRGLAGSGHTARVLSRTAAAADLPRGARACPGDLDRPETIVRALRGADAVFLMLPMSPNELTQGLATGRAAQDAGVRRLVYLSVAKGPEADQIPHFASKRAIERAVRDSGLAWTILRPHHFFTTSSSVIRSCATGCTPSPSEVADSGAWTSGTSRRRGSARWPRMAFPAFCRCAVPRP